MTFDVDRWRATVQFEDDPLAEACDEIVYLREERDELSGQLLDGFAVSARLEGEITSLRGRLRTLEQRHSALQTLWRGLPPALHEVEAVA